MTWVPSLYKARGVPVKQPVCAICADRTRGTTRRVALGYGVTVSLCELHAGEFLVRRRGRDLVVTLMRLWEAHGCLTAARHKALEAHLRTLAGTAAPRPRPGSYAWPSLRRHAEERFAAGAGFATTVREVLGRCGGGAARPPSMRTLRRWHGDRRWLTAASVGAPP
jgi:hypothetical protein